jgi:hypothetical protein
MTAPQQTISKAHILQIRDELFNVFRDTGYYPVLKELFERVIQAPPAVAKEVDIALVLGKGPVLTEADLAAARVKVRELRGQLGKYFDDQGRHQPFKVEIPKGGPGNPGYRLVFLPNTPPLGDPVNEFWGPYLSSPQNNLFMLPELLFLRDEKRTYIRNIRCNDRADRSSVKYFLRPGQRADSLLPSYHFLAAGEVMAGFNIFREFQSKKAAIAFGTVRGESRSENNVKSANLITVGSSRTNLTLADYQTGERYVVSEEMLEVSEPRREGEKATYSDTSQSDNKPTSKAFYKYAVLTRKPNLNNSFVVTLIAANHARATQGVVEFLLTNLKNADRVFQILKGDHAKLPSHFQVIFRVEILKDRGDAEIGEVQPIVARVVWPNEGEVIHTLEVLFAESSVMERPEVQTSGLARVAEVWRDRFRRLTAFLQMLG